MRRSLAVVYLLFLLTPVLVPQTEPTSPPADTGISLRVTTRMVMVDAVVTDKKGNSVADLGVGDFTILEDGKPQKIRLFSLPESLQPANQKALALPPNEFSNRPESRKPTGPLVLLLVDALNSQLSDQVYVRQRAFRYLAEEAKARRRIAIFALANNLVLLQDFTSDPNALATAIEKLWPQKAVAASRGEAFTITPQMAAGLPETLLNSLKRLNQEQAVNSIDERVRITVASLNAIARAMMGYPGRKNLVWISAGFPVSLAMEGRYADLSQNYASEVRETATLLSQAQVALYPVDSRGLSAVRESTGSDELVATVVSPWDSVLDGDPLIGAPQIADASHMAMEQLALDTGGKAYYNANDLDRAVANSIADGTSYYALGYYPENKKWDGKYRKIELKLRRKGLGCRYRRGYFAFDSISASKRVEHSELKDRLKEMQIAATDPLPATGITFRAQIVPPKPGDMKTEINLVVDSTSISFRESPSDRHQFDLDVAAFLVLPDGGLISWVHKNLVSLLPEMQYADVRQHGLPFHFQLDTASSQGDLRLVVRDNLTGLIGSLNIPLAGIKTEAHH